jgi:hypothetical protein
MKKLEDMTLTKDLGNERINLDLMKEAQNLEEMGIRRMNFGYLILGIMVYCKYYCKCYY